MAFYPHFWLYIVADKMLKPAEYTVNIRNEFLSIKKC